MSDLANHVLEGNKEKVALAVNNLVQAGTDVQDIVDQLIAGMNVVGQRFKNGEMFVPEVLMSANTMHEGMSIIKPLLTGKELRSLGTIVIGTVQGDLHDIGKNLVAMMIASGGFQVIDIGIDAPPEKFVEAVKEHNPDIVAMSALLTTTMIKMKETIELFEEEGFRKDIKVIVGGAPVSKEYSDQIGADGYAPEASSAVDLCKLLLN
ncbi:MAG: cobalamin-binding protein [Firmicutes bacterium]|nr:cobalamin-binding protein [Bacillota bacterium]